MTDDLGTKAITEFEIKDADRGEVTAVVSVLNMVDREGDVVLPGAIKDGTVVKLSGYNHDIVTEGKSPVGRGVIHIQGDRAVLSGKYFMSTQRAQEAFATVKELGAESEWSIGFPKRVKTAPMTDEWRAKGARRLIASMNVLEASPVFLGANQGTFTVATKDGDVDTIDEAAAAELETKRLADEEAARVAAEEQRKQDILAAVTKTLMEMKAAEEVAAEAQRQAAEAERQRQEMETKAAADKLAAEERSRLTELAQKEFQRFQRNIRLYG